MTIIISVGNNEHVVQFSDRRLSNAGVILENSSNKATAFACTDGRFAVGYTGLARNGNFVLQEWLVDALGRCASPDFTAVGTIDRLRAELTRLFRTHPDIRGLPAPTRRLTIMFSGYLIRPVGPRIGNLWISNFQDFDAFTDHKEAAPEFRTFNEVQPDEETGITSYIQRVGAWTAMSEEDVIVFRNLLERSAPLANIIDAGVGIVRRLSDSTKAANSVGKEVAVTIIPKDFNVEISTRVRIDSGRDEIRLVDTVSAFSEQLGTFSVRDLRISVDEPSPEKRAFQPKQGRNERCSCKSGKKFKHCHGR